MHRLTLSRVLIALISVGIGLASLATPSSAQEAAQQQDLPVQTGASLALGAALGAEGGSAFYTQMTVPIRVSRRWAIGPSFINLAGSAEGGFRSEDGEIKFGEDDRFAVGLEVRRLLGVGGEAFPLYLGARGMYSNSRQESDGLYGGILAGGEYALGSGFAIGAEVQVMGSPEHVLFVPLGLVAFHF